MIGVPGGSSDPSEDFLQLAADLRPELHAYCSRMTGSVFDGEDIVQETLARAHGAVAGGEVPASPKSWLFRIAHNAALDLLKKHERKRVDLVAEVPERSTEEAEEGQVDAELLDAALAIFAALPTVQRSALVLKDVLGHSLQQVATTTGLSVPAVKSALSRARTAIGARAAHVGVAPQHAPTSDVEVTQLKRYAALFNRRDWDGLRDLLAEEARLDLVARGGLDAGKPADYYSRYSSVVHGEGLRAEAGWVDGTPAIAVFRTSTDDARPAYFILLEWDRARIQLIRDFRYVPYVSSSARFAPF